MHSLATAISGKTGKLDPLDVHPIDADSGDGGAIESLLDERPLEEIERLLREHSLGSARGPTDNQEYLEFFAILEDTRSRIETVLNELPVSGATKVRLKRVAADLERAAQAYRDKSTPAGSNRCSSRQGRAGREVVLIVYST
jgi:hypothetical protein